MGLDLTTYAMIVEELSRGWISISGIVNTHFIGSYLLMKFGTDEQRRSTCRGWRPARSARRSRCPSPSWAPTSRRSRRRRKKPTTATGRSTARRCGSRTACSRASCSCSCKTDPDAEPPHKGMTCFIAEKEPGAAENTGDYAGLNVPPKIKKMGYKGVESTELVFDGYRCPAENILGGEEAGPQQGLRADDGRARGRPRQRRRARRRHRPARAGAGACATRRSARRSASRSPSTRRSSSSSPTWPPRSRPRGC